MKLWGGRFNKETDKLVHRFNSSLTFDNRLYHYDITGSIAHAGMLARTGIITGEEGNIIIKGLKEIEDDIKTGKISFTEECEDIHTLIEKHLIEKIGPVGGKLHTARSRNDQIALDMRLYLRDEIKHLQILITELMQTLLGLAGDYLDVIMPGYTHLQRAQPVTLAHHLMAYYFKFKRDYQRFSDNLKRVNVMPLGSGALAGTTFPVDREYLAQELGFSSISENSLDGVSDRDFILEFLSIASTLIMHFSRLSEELIIWSSSEFAFIEFDDAYATGSSIMPQKKNPDIAELTRGKTGRIYGHLIQLLTTMKGLPLAYNKDMQEDKEGLFDTVDTLVMILNIFPPMLASIKINQKRMEEAAHQGLLNATDLADYLASKGLPFRQAHEVVGRAVLYAIEQEKELEEISLSKWQELFPEIKDYFNTELYDYLNIRQCIEGRKVTGGTAPARTKEVIKKEKKWMGDLYSDSYNDKIDSKYFEE